MPLEDPDEARARNSPRAVAAALLMVLVILAAGGIFLWALLARACR